MALTDDALRADGTGAITRVLCAAGAGDPVAAAELLPLVYQQLRRLAKSRLRRERPDQTLQATALVHEAYLRLVGQTVGQDWDGRWHFFAAAAEAMRRILVDNARRKGRLKRGGGGVGGRRVSLDTIDLTVGDPPDDLLALDEALAEFAREHPEKAQLVKLRYFAGLTMDEAAEALGISPRTAGRNWAYARAWLFSRITSG
jgi:RNA polymerase sigma factor (TIGR02999 family)